MKGYATKRKKADATSLWENSNVVSAIGDFYDNLAKAMPLMLGYRYHSQIFSQFTNADGKSVVDYPPASQSGSESNDNANNVIVKTLPIMDFTKMYTTFKDAYSNNQLGGGEKFSASHCVIDLTSVPFKMTFQDAVNVNASDEFKTGKLVLARVPRISG